MKKEWIDLNNFSGYELTVHELMHIDAGGFWKTLGTICGAIAGGLIALVVICIAMSPPHNEV
jgi:hypothetical protein